MKRILIAATLAMAAAGQTFAADLPPAAAPPRAPAANYPAVAPTYNWSGFYIGGNAGYGWATADVTDTIVGGPFSGLNSTSTGIKMNGAIAGGQIGVNFQTGPLVLGLEGDLQWSGQKESTVYGCGVGCTVTEEGKINWFATARGRIGVAADRVLLYGTGGAAWINATDSLTGSVPAGTATLLSLSSTSLGWAAGAGVEVAFTENLTARIEYLYMQANNFSANAATIPVLGGTITETATIKDSIIRAGLNLKFGGGQ
jgi:outer membrane immunogenic protein